jgi:signal transduction histidine kinase
VRSISLTVAHRFCELLGGELRAISTPGQHAAFTMRLPIRGTSTQS